jgi:hypothetical protein
MDDGEMAIYKSVCRDRLPKSISHCVDMVMYLDVDPAECHRRVTTLRQNKAEDGIPLPYMEGVDTTYFHLFMDWLGQVRCVFFLCALFAVGSSCLLLCSNGR